MKMVKARMKMVRGRTVEELVREIEKVYKTDEPAPQGLLVLFRGVRYDTIMVKCKKCGFSYAGWKWKKEEEEGKEKMHCPRCGSAEIAYVEVESKKEGDEK